MLDRLRRGGLLSRLLPRLSRTRSVPARRLTNPAAVVDCALYTSGRRQPGRPHFADAYARSRRRGTYVWLGLHDPDPELMAEVGRTFGLHELTVAHAVSEGHRPAVERHGDVTVLVMRTARYVEHAELTPTSEVVDTGDVSVYLGDRFVITVRHGSAGALADVRSTLEQRPALLGAGPWAVAWAVCARMVEQYLEVAGHLETDMEHLEETVFSHRAPDVQQIYQLKRELVEFKRAVMPLQPRLQSLLQEDRGTVPAPLLRYFEDVVGRLARAVERVAAFDELLNSVLQARLAQVAIDQNNDMRKIAAWAAIAGVQTVIAGIYGMNFTYMPELGWKYGFYLILAVMAAAGLTVHRLFRRSGWL
jgi:magnesium transporter